MANCKTKKFIFILIIIVFPLKNYAQTFGFDADRGIGNCIREIFNKN